MSCVDCEPRTAKSRGVRTGMVSTAMFGIPTACGAPNRGPPKGPRVGMPHQPSLGVYVTRTSKVP
eukprot:2239855-Pyramimonas_sp.AAC.1